MFRRSINSMTPQEQQEFISAVDDYLNSDPNILQAHLDYHVNIMPNDIMMGFEGVSFLNWHRDYIMAFEDYLTRTGHEDLTPLPEWHPGEPIPEPFRIGLANHGAAMDPGISFSPMFDPQNLRNFRSLEDLGMAILELVSIVHIEIGGDASFDFFGFRSPRAPIFWPWHAFIDEIRFDWQWQWLGSMSAVQLSIVPNLVGLSFAAARRMLATFGLQIGYAILAPHYHSSGTPPVHNHFVVSQNPAPGTPAAPGTLVDVWGGNR